MIVLAFDTCLDACSVAVADVEGGMVTRLVSRFEPMVRGQAERLVPMIAEVFDAAGLAPSAIERIAVTHGPGTFTGTRIGVSAARALSLATGAGLVAVSSLECMARNPEPGIAPGERFDDLVIAVDAHRSEVYVQIFAASGREPRSDPRRLSVEDAAKAIHGRAAVLAGSGASLIQEAASRSGEHVAARSPGLLPRAEDMIVIAERMSPLAEPLRPIYLRPPDARPQDGKSLARALS